MTLRKPPASSLTVIAGALLLFFGACSSDKVTDRKNRAPERPHDPIPADGAAAQPATLTLRWQSADPDSDKVTFNIRLDTISPPLAQPVGYTTEPLLVVSLSQGRQYYWRVTALDDNGGSDNGPVWTFRTGVFHSGWSEAASMNVARLAAMGDAHGGKIYVFGGIGSDGELRSAESYDPATNVWSMLPSMPWPRSYGVAIAAGESIYLIGGGSTQNPLSRVDRFDVATNQWYEVAPLPSPRSRFAAAVYGKRILVFGGYENDLAILSYDTEVNRWDTAGFLATSRNGHSVVVAEDFFYITGGSTDRDFWLARHDRWDPRDGDFKPLAPMPSARRDHRAVAVDGRIIVTGGFNAIVGHVFFGSVEMFDPKSGQWYTRSTMTTPRHDHVAVALGGKVYCIGGLAERAPDVLSSVEVYEPAADQ